MALDALMLVTNPRRGRKSKRRFSAKQRAAQRLFAQRARAGTLGGRRRNPKRARRSVTGKMSKAAWLDPDRPARKKSRRFRRTVGATTTPAWGTRKRSNMARRRRSRRRRNIWRGQPRRHAAAARKGWRRRRGARTGTTRRRGRRSSGLTKKERRRRAGKKAWRTRKARASYRAGGGLGPFKNPRRRRSRRGRRRNPRRRRTAPVMVYSRRRRRWRRVSGKVYKRRRRGGYRRINRRRGRRRSVSTYRRRRRSSRRRSTRRRRNPGRSMLSRLNPFRRRRSRRRNPGFRFGRGAFGLIRPAVAALAGWGATRVLPGLVAKFAPNALSSVLGAAGSWAGVVLAGGSVVALGFASSKIRFLRAYRGNLMLGATMALVMEIAQRILPPAALETAGLSPAGNGMSGWLPRDRSQGISGYVSELNDYIPTPMGAYVEEAVGAEAYEAVGGLGVEVAPYRQPGCRECTGGLLSPNSLNARALPPMTAAAHAAAIGQAGDATREIVPRAPREILGTSYCGIFGDSMWGK